MLTLLWCTTSYTVIIVLWKLLVEPVKALARWRSWACLNCGSGLRILEKTLDLLRCVHVFDRVLKCGSEINEGNWLQLLFYLFVLVGIVVPLLEWVFLICVSGLKLKFSRIAFWWKHLQLDSKNDLAFNGLIFGSFVREWLLSLTSYLYGLKSATIAKWLLVFDDINFFRCFVRGLFWSVL